MNAVTSYIILLPIVTSCAQIVAPLETSSSFRTLQTVDFHQTKKSHYKDEMWNFEAIDTNHISSQIDAILNNAVKMRLQTRRRGTEYIDIRDIIINEQVRHFLLRCRDAKKWARRTSSSLKIEPSVFYKLEFLDEEGQCMPLDIKLWFKQTEHDDFESLRDNILFFYGLM